MNSPARAAASVTAFLAAALILGTGLAAGSPSLSLLGFTAWAAIPYALLYALSGSKRATEPWPFVGAGAVAIAMELGVRAAVFFFPKHSTAAVALIFSPALIAVIGLPAGAAMGFLLGKAWKSGRSGTRAAAGVGFGVVLALIVLGLGRPEWFPTAILARRAALKALGEPRVVLGADRFKKELVSEKPGWHLAAELDGAPGDELAVVDPAGADLFDAADFKPKGRIEFQAPRLWNWFSVLARLNGRVVVVNTGGGFSPTVVHELDGRIAWEHHPDDRLPPNALRPSDLDGRGAPDLYAASQRALSRLDAKGKVVWSREANSPQLIALAPRTATATAWIATRESGRPVKIWDEKGVALGEIDAPPGREPVAVVDWPEQRALVLGGDSARVVGLDGKAVLEFPLAPASLLAAASWKPAPGDRPLLALLSAAPRGVSRWRLTVLGADGAPVYDEVLAAPLRLLKAARADGGETLLLSAADGLRALR